MSELAVIDTAELVARENIRLGGWLARVQNAQQALQELVGDNEFAHFHGMMQRFEAADSTLITIEADGVDLEKAEFMGGTSQLSTPATYGPRSWDTFPGAWAIEARLDEGRDEEGEHQYDRIGVDYIAIEANPLPSVARISDLILPQVNFSIVERPTID